MLGSRDDYDKPVTSPSDWRNWLSCLTCCEEDDQAADELQAYLEKLIANNERLSSELAMIKNAPDNDWQLIAKSFEQDRTELMRQVATTCREIAINEKSIYGGNGYNEACFDIAEAIKQKFGLKL